VNVVGDRMIAVRRCTEVCVTARPNQQLRDEIDPSLNEIERWRKINAAFQMRGVCKFMIFEVVKKFPDAVARVKMNSEASHALFNSAGFALIFTIYS
jgi:hypothetical protein